MENFRLDRTIKVTDIVNVKHVIEDFYVFRQTKRTSIVGRNARIKRIEGVTKECHLENVKTQLQEFVGLDDTLTLVRKEFIINLRKFGWPSHDSTDVSWSYADWEKCISKHPFGDSDNEDEYIWVRIDNYSNQLQNINGDWLPVAIHFGYISEYMDNAHYDLKKVFEILGQNQNVTIIAENYRPCDAHIAETPDEAIYNIPYYNATQTTNMAMSFLWSPTVEEYRTLMDFLDKSGKTYTERAWAIFELDMLGLRAGGAALFNKFYQSKEDDKTRDYD